MDIYIKELILDDLTDDLLEYVQKNIVLWFNFAFIYFLPSLKDDSPIIGY